MSDACDEQAAEIDPAHLVDRRGRCRLAYEPIADLARGEICGYEAVVRYGDGIAAEAWRVEATRRGLEPDLDAFVVRSVMQARESLPPGCFLSFNIGSERLLRTPVQAVLARSGRLEGLVVELCPRFTAPHAERIVEAVAALRELGAKIALDEVGGDVGVLPHAGIVRSDFVKLAPSLVARVHRDDAKLAIVEAIGHLASRFDAWVIAQGVEQIEELDALMSIGVPLAQGPLIGVRAKTLTPVAFVLSAYVRERGAAAIVPGAIAALVELIPPHERDDDPERLTAAFDADPAVRFVPLVDERRRPVGMAERAAHARGEAPAAQVLKVPASSSIPEVAQRAMLREPETRFHPLVCCDGGGRYVGIVRIERLVSALAAARGA